MNLALSVEDYLDRIGYDGPIEVTPEILRRLHRAHLLHVPFENVDMLLENPTELSVREFYDKVVRRRRGGTSFELNGLFAWALGRLGFSAQLLPARSAPGLPDEGPGPPFDHAVVRVDLDGPWLADVGFGDSFRSPFPIEDGTSEDQSVWYRVVGLANGDHRLLRRDAETKSWESRYSFRTTPYELKDFRVASRWQQISPRSPYRSRLLCNRATPGGRVALTGDRLHATEGGQHHLQRIRSLDELLGVLVDRFEIDVSQEPRFERLAAQIVP